MYSKQNLNMPMPSPAFDENGMLALHDISEFHTPREHMDMPMTPFGTIDPNALGMPHWFNNTFMTLTPQHTKTNIIQTGLQRADTTFRSLWRYPASYFRYVAPVATHLQGVEYLLNLHTKTAFSTNLRVHALETIFIFGVMCQIWVLAWSGILIWVGHTSTWSVINGFLETLPNICENDRGSGSTNSLVYLLWATVLTRRVSTTFVPIMLRSIVEAEAFSRQSSAS